MNDLQTNPGASRSAEAILSAARALVHFGTWEVDLLDPEHLENNPARWSDEVYRILGHELGGVCPSSRTFLAMVHPDDRAGLESVVARAIATGEDFVDTHRIIRPAGEVRYVREHGRILDPAQPGGPRLLVGAMQDVTDQSKEERKFRALVESAPDAMVIIDAQRRIVLVNGLTERMFGYGRQELVGRHLGLLMPERFRSAHRGHEAAFLRDPRARPMGAGLRLAALRADGTEFPVEISLGPLQTDEGLLISASIRDVSQREQVLEQVREQAMLIEKAADAIVVRDLQDRVLLWNNAAEQLFHRPAAAVMGHAAGTALQIHKAALAHARAAVLERGQWSGELKAFPAGKREIVLQSHWTLLRDAHGAPKSILTTFSDITEQKRLEAQAYRAQRLESIGTLAGGIAHDLNNILTPIVMSVGTLRQAVSRPEDQQTLDLVALSAERGTQILRQMLAFARGVEGERITFPAGRLIREMASMVEQTFPKSIAVSVSITPDLHPITANITQLEQVVLNLCVNARDAMPQGGRLELTARNTEVDKTVAALHPDAAAGPYVQLSVRDTGTGIPTALQEKIFEPFFTTKKPGEGTGLGLSTCHAIVRSHGGFLTVTSRPGEGAEFSIYLPATIAAARAPTAPRARTSFQPGHDQMILVVDDEEAIRIVIARILEAAGYRVLTAKNGAEAVAQYTQHGSGIAVVLTDMAMPVMDGTVTILSLRQINPAVRIIAMTGMDALIAEAGQAGAIPNRILQKPFTVDEVLGCVAELIQARS